jgi:putative redox protein
MSTAEITYQTELRTEAIHTASGTRIFTDAPKDNHGKGEAFSPTDLLSASLAQCMLTIVGILAKNHGFSIDGTKASVEKVMSASPRRVSEINITLKFPTSIQYSEKEKAMIENAAKTCPVALSLHPDVKQGIKLIW